jgi:hypothetical protein
MITTKSNDHRMIYFIVNTCGVASASYKPAISSGMVVSIKLEHHLIAIVSSTEVFDLKKEYQAHLDDGWVPK